MENTCKRNSIINFNTVLKQIIKIIKLNLQNEKEKIKELILNTMSPKIEGYVYCIYNDLYNLYEEPIYKIGNAKNVNRRLQEYNNIYLDKCNLKHKVKVPHKMLFEFFIMCNLCKYRLVFEREFFTNYNEIEKEFIYLENILKNNLLENVIDIYIDKILNNPTLKLIFNKIKIESNNKIDDYIQKELLMCNKYNNEIIKNKIINKDIIKDKNKILINDKIENGYIIHLEILQIKKYYDDKISILISKTSDSVKDINTYFIGNIKILNKIKVKYLNLAKYIINDLIGNKCINKLFYNCKNEIIEKVIDVLKYYFNKYKNKKDIYYAYVNDKYNNKINIVLEENIKDYSFIYKKYMKLYENDYDIKDDIKYIDNKINNV